MRADVGFNEVDLLLRNHLFEEEFDRIPYMYDVAVIRAFEHVVVPIDKLK
jgi:carbamoyl-phosphate synthase large subunit